MKHMKSFILNQEENKEHINFPPEKNNLYYFAITHILRTKIQYLFGFISIKILNNVIIKAGSQTGYTILCTVIANELEFPCLTPRTTIFVFLDVPNCCRKFAFIIQSQ